MFTEIGYHALGLAFPLTVEAQDGTILQIVHFYELNGGVSGKFFADRLSVCGAGHRRIPVVVVTEALEGQLAWP